jgi:4-amino-4-deoxy-L-arabinose transferase-like glycosyltransferase
MRGPVRALPALKSDTASHRSTALVALAVFAWLACTAGLRPLLLPDEGRYVGVAWEMLRSGDWLTPTLDGLPFFHKPPLFYWITAGSLGLFGANEWAGRMAPMLGATLAAVAGYRFLGRWAPAAAPRVLVVLLTQPLFFFSAQYANLDMLVAGCISACTLALADALLRLEAGEPHRRALLAAWLFAALGVLAKGLIGFVLPGAAVFVWLLASGRWRRLPALLWWPGPLLFAAVAVPWFVAMHLRFAEFAHYFFVVQHFERFSAQGFNNALPIWFYPAVLLVTMLPWTLWLPALLRRSAWTGEAARLALLMAIWFTVVLVFFSLPKSKLVGYILPAVPIRQASGSTAGRM